MCLGTALVIKCYYNIAATTAWVRQFGLLFRHFLRLSEVHAEVHGCFLGLFPVQFCIYLLVASNPVHNVCAGPQVFYYRFPEILP